MIVAIDGRVVKKDTARVDIKLSSGITYGVFISLNTSYKITNENIELFIKEVIKEDSYSMYGFIDNDEKVLFEQLIKLNGIGPKVAMNVCSTYTPNEFFNIIHLRDINAIKKISGIGPKVANRMILELANVLVDADSEILSSFFREATDALLGLGFNKSKISSVLKKCKSQDTASLIKEALRQL